MSSAGSGASDPEKKHGYVNVSQHQPAPHVEEGEQWLISYADLMTLLVGFFVILLSFSTVDQEKMEDVRKALSNEFGGSYQAPFEKMAERLRENLKKLGLGDEFKIIATARGVEILFYGTVFFDLGSANLKPQGSMLLDQLIPLIRAEAPAFLVTIEGHTDDVPIANGKVYRNNWELSSLRACRVLEVFELNGFKKTELTAIGFGEAKPIVPNRDAQNVPIIANQAQNRRVVIKLTKPSEAVLETSATAAP